MGWVFVYNSNLLYVSYLDPPALLMNCLENYTLSYTSVVNQAIFAELLYNPTCRLITLSRYMYLQR